MFRLVQKEHHLNLPLSALTKLLACLKMKSSKKVTLIVIRVSRSTQKHQNME